MVATRRRLSRRKYQRGTTPATGKRAGSPKPLYQWTSEEYADGDQNWATIDAVNRIALELGATSSQVALSWIANRPGVTAPIVGARTVKHLAENLGALELALTDEHTIELEKVSTPKSGGYPYWEFGAWQRGRDLKDGSGAPQPPFAAGSDRPTGTA